jgi:hypothetical protein
MDAANLLAACTIINSVDTQVISIIPVVIAMQRFISLPAKAQALPNAVQLAALILGIIVHTK